MNKSIPYLPFPPYVLADLQRGGQKKGFWYFQKCRGQEILNQVQDDKNMYRTVGDTTLTLTFQ